MTVPQQRVSLLKIARQLICRLVCDEKPTPVPPSQVQQAISFLPGQVHVLAEYPSALKLSKSDAVKRIQAKLEEVARDDKIDDTTRELIGALARSLTPERVSILVGEQLTLAAAFGDVPSERQNPARLLRSISRLNTSIHKPPLTPPNTDKGGGTQDYPPGQTSFDQARQSPPAPPSGAVGQAGAGGAPLGVAAPAPAAAAAVRRSINPDGDGFDLRAAGPNWLSNGAPHIITGGPAAVPLDETDAPPLWQFGDRTDLAAPEGDDIHDTAEIAILDSVPALQDLQNAYRTWIGNGDLNPPPPIQPLNPLLHQLLSNPADGHFDVSNTGQVEVVYPFPDLTPAVVSSGHEYAMSSHGLFVAGIIRSLAPQAKVRLVRVLNNNCIGTVESIHSGLAVIMQAPTPTRLIVNCSFVLCVPRPGDTAPLPADIAAALASGDTPLTLAEIASLTQGLQDALALAAGPNNIVVAAAGNTGSGGANPLARFPAAFSDVFGVGSLNDDDPSTPPLLASYSDQPDDQLNEGFAAYAGLAAAVAGGSSIPSMTSDSDAIIGAFIDPWPEQIPPLPPSTLPSYLTQANTSGLARWAGTSFATPIVVAALANCYIRGNNRGAAITQLKTTAPLLPGGAAAIEATQG